MNDTMERHVTLNNDQELYVINTGTGITCLGYDNTVDEIERICIELAGRLDMPEDYMQTVVSTSKANRGLLSNYDTLVNLRDRLRVVCESQDEQAMCGLSPQLIGLEGHRVEVTEDEGLTKRRFVVGKSTGWMPCHLELSLRTSSDGPAARREYEYVEDLGKVR